MVGTVTTRYKLDSSGNVVSSQVVARDTSDRSLEPSTPPTVTPTPDVVPVVNKSDNYTKQVNDYLAQQAGTYGKVSVPATKLSQALNKANAGYRYTDEAGNVVELSTSQKAAIALQPYFASGKGNYGEVGRSQAKDYYASQGLPAPQIESVADRSLAQQTKQGVFYTPSSTATVTEIQRQASQQGMVAIGSVQGGGYLGMTEADYNKMTGNTTSQTGGFIFNRAEADKRFPGGSLSSSQSVLRAATAKESLAMRREEKYGVGGLRDIFEPFYKGLTLQPQNIQSMGSIQTALATTGIVFSLAGGGRAKEFTEPVKATWGITKAVASKSYAPFTAIYNTILKAPGVSQLAMSSSRIVSGTTKVGAGLITYFGAVRPVTGFVADTYSSVTASEGKKILQDLNVPDRIIAGRSVSTSEYVSRGSNIVTQWIRGNVAQVIPSVTSKEEYQKGVFSYLASQGKTLTPVQQYEVSKYLGKEFTSTNIKQFYEVLYPEMIANVVGGAATTALWKISGGARKFSLLPTATRVVEYAKTRTLPGAFEGYVSTYATVTNIPTSKRGTGLYSWETPVGEKGMLDYYNKDGKVLRFGTQGLSLIGGGVGAYTARTFAKIEGWAINKPKTSAVVDVLGQASDFPAEPLGDFMTPSGKVRTVSFNPNQGFTMGTPTKQGFTLTNVKVNEPTTVRGKMGGKSTVFNLVSTDTFSNANAFNPVTSKVQSDVFSNVNVNANVNSLVKVDTKQKTDTKQDTETKTTVTTSKLPLFTIPGIDLFGRRNSGGGRGASLFSAYTPNLRGIESGARSLKGQGRFTGLEVRGLATAFSLGSKPSRRRRK